MEAQARKGLVRRRRRLPGGHFRAQGRLFPETANEQVAIAASYTETRLRTLAIRANNRRHGVPPFCARFPAGAGRLLLRSHHAPFFGSNPFTPKLRGCTAIPLPAHATCGRDKRRPRCVRLGGGALAVESAGHQWKRAERTAIRAALSGEDRATAVSERRGQPRRTLRRSGAQRPSGLPGRAVAS